MSRPPLSDLEFVNRAARFWDNDETGEIGYHPRLFCQLALPYKDPGELPFWERRNGDFSLTVRPAVETATDGRRRVAYPFGSVPRLPGPRQSRDSVRHGLVGGDAPLLVVAGRA